MDYLSVQPLNICTTKAGLAAGTTTTLTTANTSLYSLLGKAYSKAAASNAATPTTDIVTGAAFVAVTAGYGSVYVIAYDSGGTLRVAQGQVNALDAAGNFVTAPQFPTLPDSLCAIGYIVVKVASGGASWTFGSSNLAGPPANTTITYTDVFTLPGRPQVA